MNMNPLNQAPQPPQPPNWHPPSIPPANPGQGKAIASMVCGICGIVFSYLPFFGLGAAIAGLILASMAHKEGNRSGIRTAGLVCSIIGVVFGGFFTISVLSVIACIPFMWRYF
ncbi:MAG: DUF4190 domain-containing protein [Defluviitaleaceae bacterium]|nr:DUF4190 domain-containing protein [Defluviitaleaceae bacterium]